MCLLAEQKNIFNEKEIAVNLKWRVDWKQGSRRFFPDYAKKELLAVASEVLTIECMDVERQLPGNECMVCCMRFQPPSYTTQSGVSFEAK